MKRRELLLLMILILMSVFIFGCENNEPNGLGDLFDDVYYKLVTKDDIIDEEALLDFLDNTDYEYTYTEETRSYQVIDPNADNDNYVYVALSPLSTLIDNVSYYDSVNNKEVNVYNGSEDKDKEFEFMHIHVLGEKKERVDSIDEQIEFLKENE